MQIPLNPAKMSPQPTKPGSQIHEWLTNCESSTPASTMLPIATCTWRSSGRTVCSPRSTAALRLPRLAFHRLRLGSFQTLRTRISLRPFSRASHCDTEHRLVHCAHWEARRGPRCNQGYRAAPSVRRASERQRILRVYEHRSNLASRRRSGCFGVRESR